MRHQKHLIAELLDGVVRTSHLLSTSARQLEESRRLLGRDDGPMEAASSREDGRDRPSEYDLPVG